ncbi:ribosome-binding factor A [Patescibacteria group bacterium]|nr:ribosome-binding factor A [Patescibacteria group bacterium]
MKVPHTRRLEEGGGMQHFRDALAAVLAQRIEFPRGVLVTVVNAKITSDTRNAKGVLSVLPEDKQTEVLKILKASEHDIKDGLAERLRLRRIPNLHWSFDTNEAYVGTIDDVINELKKKGEL